MSKAASRPDLIARLLDGGFRNRSGRVIAFARLLLATAFLLAIWLDPTQPTHAPAAGYAVLAAYLVFALLLLLSTWNNWWLERRLALPAHVLDIATFTIMVFLTEGYTSPFFTFFVFLLLSATIRWGWRETAITSAVIIPAYLAAGVAALMWGGGDFELQRFLIRGAYLSVVSLILIWFGIHQRDDRAPIGGELDPEHASEATQSLIRRMMEYAAARTGAGRIIFTWSEKEEPWVQVATFDGDRFDCRRFGPDRYAELVDSSLSASVFLFDGRKEWVLAQTPNGRGRLVQGSHAVNSEFAEDFSIRSGVAVPIETADYLCQLFILEVEGLSPDFLKIGQSVGDEIAVSLERLSTLKMSDESAVARTRLALARDLHDSVVQLLAGTSFRLEAIRNAAHAGKEIDADIDALQAELSQEQQDLRKFISSLRSMAGTVDAHSSLALWVDRLARQWGINCKLVGNESSAEIPSHLEHEIHQLVREAVSNAVRHGGARTVEISVRAGDTIELEVADDGCGFPAEGSFSEEDLQAGRIAPWSLSERVRSLGGRFSLFSSRAGARIMVSLPMEAK